MDIEKAFSVCIAEVTCEGADAPPDYYAVTEAELDVLKLEAERKSLHTVPLESDSIVTVSAFQPDAAYVIKARVLRCLVGNIVTVIVEQQGEIQRVQRRRHFRVEIKLPLKVTSALEDDPFEFELKTTDVSGGGLKAILPREIPLGDTTSVALDLLDGRSWFQIAAKVLRCFPNGKGAFVTCFEFQDVSKKVMNLLLRFVTAEMRRTLNL